MEDITMASRIQAINTYRPQVTLGKTVQDEELIRYRSAELVEALPTAPG